MKKKKYLCTVLINITRYNLKYTNVKIMKKWMLFSIIFLLMGTVGLTGCSSDDNDNKEFVEMGQVSNQEGEMRFNSENNQWYIYTFTEGTYDAVRLYYPIQLDDTYKTDGQKVLFSGTYGATDYVAGTPAGTELFIIKLTSISKR